jgi:uncharacterized protein (DUF58 family)
VADVITREMLAQVRRIQVRTDRMVTDVMAGGYTSVFRGSGIEFDEVREFTEGDDLRSVDWNVTARTGRPFVKKFMEERELTVLLLLDTSPSMGFGSDPRAPGQGAPEPRPLQETAALFCGCIAFAAARNNDKVGLITFGSGPNRYVPAKKGRQHALRLVREAFAPSTGPEVAGRSTLAATLAYAGRVQRRRAVVFVVSDFLGDGGPPVQAAGPVHAGSDRSGTGRSALESCQKELRILARRHDLTAVRLRDPRTEELPPRGLHWLRDLETGRGTWVDCGSRRVREQHARNVAEDRAAFHAACRSAGVDELAIDLPWPAAGAAPEERQRQRAKAVANAIVAFFRMRELRGGHG